MKGILVATRCRFELHRKQVVDLAALKMYTLETRRSSHDFCFIGSMVALAAHLTSPCHRYMLPKSISQELLERSWVEYHIFFRTLVSDFLFSKFTSKPFPLTGCGLKAVEVWNQSFPSSRWIALPNQLVIYISDLSMTSPTVFCIYPLKIFSLLLKKIK